MVKRWTSLFRCDRLTRSYNDTLSCRGKAVPVLNQALRHEKLWGSDV
jgi:hypothetical protein